MSAKAYSKINFNSADRLKLSFFVQLPAAVGNSALNFHPICREEKAGPLMSLVLPLYFH